MYVQGGASPDALYKLVQRVINKRGQHGTFSQEFVSGIAVDLQNGIEQIWGPYTAEEARLARNVIELTDELLVFWQKQGPGAVTLIPDVYLRQVLNARHRLEKHRVEAGEAEDEPEVQSQKPLNYEERQLVLRGKASERERCERLLRRAFDVLEDEGVALTYRQARAVLAAVGVDYRAD